MLVWAAAATAGETCQTPSGIPCFTLEYEQSVWAVVKSPRRDLVMTTVKGVMAVRADGSMVHRIAPADRFTVRDRDATPAPFLRLYLAASNRMISTDPPAGFGDFRIPALFFITAPARRIAAGDTGCRQFAAALLAVKTVESGGAASKLLGEPVTLWKAPTAAGGTTNIMTAPGLDCQVLRYEAADYRYRYMPVRKELFEAKSLKRGEPNPALFAEPAAAKGK